MTGPIDRAFVTIEPDFSNFDAQARSGIDRGLQSVEVSAVSTARDIERAFADMTRELVDEFRRLDDSISNAMSSSGYGVSDIGADIASSIDRGVDQAVADANRLSRQFDQSFDEIRRDARTTGTSIGASLGGLAAGGAAIAGIAAIGAGLVAVGSFGLQSAASLEQLPTSFNSLLGSAEKGQAVFTDLQKFAAATPFEFPDVARASARFLAFNDSVGISDERLKEFLTTTGNVISVTGGGAQALESVTLAMGQIASSGKLT